MNKKGIITLDLMQWLQRIVFLVIVIFCVVFLIRLSVDTDVSVSEAEMSLLMYRILYSENGISYFDSEIGRSYPGVVPFESLEKLDSIMSDLIYFGEKNTHFAANFEFYDNEENLIYSYTFNKRKWRIWKVLAALNMKGAGGVVDSGERSFFVTLKSEQDMPAILRLRVIMPK